MKRENHNDISTICAHETAEPLGFGGGTEFLRCVACRSVIITQGGLSLAIPPVQPAPLAESAQPDLRKAG